MLSYVRMNGIYLLFLFVTIVTANSGTEEVECVDNPDCPNPDHEYVTHLPYEPDCHKFYKCNKGQGCLMTCPKFSGNHRLVFNPETQTCDWPQNVPNAPNCDNSEETTSSSSTTSTATTSTATTSSATTSTATTPSITTTTVQTSDDPSPPQPADGCPKTGKKRIKDKSNCNYYFDCNNGESVRRKCYEHTVFNPYTETCDLPSNIPCTTS